MTHATLTTGLGDLPKVILSAPDGAQAEIYLHGGHVTSWRPASTQIEQLFLSNKSEFRPGAAIRGGVPVIFPQFSMQGPLPRHGFARTATWTFSDTEQNEMGQVTAKFQLSDSEATRAIWPHGFLAELAVTVGGDELTLAFSVTNNDEQPFSFTGALHTYLKTTDIETARIENLQGVSYQENNHDYVSHEPSVIFRGEVDRIYFNAPRSLHIHTQPQPIEVQLAGFPDAVIWNPGAVKGAALADMEADGYRHMVCVEAAVIGQPVQLAPQERWQGSQRITII